MTAMLQFMITRNGSAPGTTHGGRLTRGQRRLATTFALALAASLLPVGAAHADDDEIYDPAQLLTSCAEDTELYGKAHRCRFEPSSYEPFTGNVEQVSGVDANCGDAVVLRSVSWAQTVGESNSIAVSVTVQATLSKIFTVSVMTTYTHTWERSSTVTDTVMVNIPPKQAATVFRGAALAKVTGRMVINFSSRRQGHYEWYVYPELVVPAEDQPRFARVTTNTRPLTPAELAECPSVPPRVASGAAARPAIRELIGA